MLLLIQPSKEPSLSSTKAGSKPSTKGWRNQAPPCCKAKSTPWRPMVFCSIRPTRHMATRMLQGFEIQEDSCAGISTGGLLLWISEGDCEECAFSWLVFNLPTRRFDVQLVREKPKATRYPRIQENPGIHTQAWCWWSVVDALALVPVLPAYLLDTNSIDPPVSEVIAIPSSEYFRLGLICCCLSVAKLQQVPMGIWNPDTQRRGDSGDTSSLMSYLRYRRLIVTVLCYYYHYDYNAHPASLLYYLIVSLWFYVTIEQERCA